MKRLLFSFCALFLFPASLLAQQNQTPVNFSNADDVLLREKAATDPSLMGKYVIYEQNLKQVMEASKVSAPGAKTDTLINGKRIIPVVFHIIHKGGPENISRDQILDAIALLNIDYNKLNSDTDSVHSWPAFASRRANCNIEFRLARIDPVGNCTEGIVRHYDPQTNYAYFTIMSQYAWPPSRYLNVFSVAFIYPEGINLPANAFIGGMSPFPPSNPLSQALTGGDTLADGVLIRHDGLGSIGTATTLGGMPINALNRTFTHESGHYFNLYHPFQNLILGLIPATDGCPTLLAPNGDEVSDTPPVKAASQNISVACYVPGSRNTCNQDVPDEPDMAENYMDYQWGYCSNIFTNGQYSRIDATLNGDRQKLWSVENLIATGVLDTTASVCPPVADFYANSVYVCAGGSVNFTDYSYGGTADSWSWTFNGGTPATWSAQNPTIQYNIAGIYDVKLVASNIHGSDSLIRTAYIHVNDPALSDTTPFTEDFESGSLNDWVVTNDVGNAWEITSSASYSGSNCLNLHNFDNNSPGSYDEIVSPLFDLTTLPSGILPLVKFRLAYAGKYIAATLVTAEDTAYDKLSMYISSNCGATWTQKYNKTGLNLATVTTLPDNFTPSSSADWRQETVSLPMTYLNSNSVMLKFVFHSSGANNIYIDDINITNVTAGIDEDPLSHLDVSIYPNPVTGNSVITFQLAKKRHVEISVLDLLGRNIYSIIDENMDAGEHRLNLDRSRLGCSGMYFIKICIDGQPLMKKIIAE